MGSLVQKELFDLFDSSVLDWIDEYLEYWRKALPKYQHLNKVFNENILRRWRTTTRKRDKILYLFLCADKQRKDTGMVFPYAPILVDGKIPESCNVKNYFYFFPHITIAAIHSVLYNTSENPQTGASLLDYLRSVNLHRQYTDYPKKLFQFLVRQGNLKEVQHHAYIDKRTYRNQYPQQLECVHPYEIITCLNMFETYTNVASFGNNLYYIA